MEKIDLRELYKKQISLTEWFEQIGHKDVTALRTEDNFKRDRMGQVAEVIPFPFDKPTNFPASDLVNRTAEFEQFLEERGDELCALRLVPLEEGLPKLRMRGHSIKDVLVEWFPEQNIDHTKYRASFVPHPNDHLWSTIFVVNEHGMFGEAIAGSHNQLTQGFHDEGTPIFFHFDFSTWKISDEDPGAKKHLEEIASFLYVPEKERQDRLKEEVSAVFHHDYLAGYFETVQSTDFGTWFIDYNRVLGESFLPPQIGEKGSGDLVGRTVVGGSVTGRGYVLEKDQYSADDFEEGDILVCHMTAPMHLPLMKKAGAVVTEAGGLLSHAAIVCRELKKPCVIGVEQATNILKIGDQVSIDASNGVIGKV